jgi:hypothetical protein
MHAETNNATSSNQLTQTDLRRFVMGQAQILGYHRTKKFNRVRHLLGLNGKPKVRSLTGILASNARPGQWFAPTCSKFRTGKP